MVVARPQSLPPCALSPGAVAEALPQIADHFLLELCATVGWSKDEKEGRREPHSRHPQEEEEEQEKKKEKKRKEKKRDIKQEKRKTKK